MEPLDTQIYGTTRHTNNSPTSLPNIEDKWQHQTDRSRGQTMIQAYFYM